MKTRRFLFLALAAALCVSLAAPASAMEKSLWPEYYSLESEYTWMDRDVDFHYIMNETVTTYDGTGYYTIEGGTPFTLTNIRDDEGYVFVYYEPYTMQTEPLELWVDSDGDGQGARTEFQGEYICYNNGYSRQYYLNQDGEWELQDGILNVF